MPRRKPYTRIGIRRRKCSRCKQPAEAQWVICACGQGPQTLCRECDAALNELVLRFLRIPDWRQKMKAYRAEETTCQ